jgi:hypothetical protein
MEDLLQGISTLVGLRPEEENIMPKVYCTVYVVVDERMVYPESGPQTFWESEDIGQLHSIAGLTFDSETEAEEYVAKRWERHYNDGRIKLKFRPFNS